MENDTAALMVIIELRQKVCALEARIRELESEGAASEQGQP